MCWAYRDARGDAVLTNENKKGMGVMEAPVDRVGILIDMAWNADQQHSSGVLYPFWHVQFLFRVPRDWLGAELRVSGTVRSVRRHCVLVAQEVVCVRRKEDLMVLASTVTQETRRTRGESSQSAVVAALLFRPLRWLHAGRMNKWIARLEGLSVKTVKRLLANPYSCVTSRTLSFSIAECVYHILGGEEYGRDRIQAGITDVLHHAVERGLAGVDVVSLSCRVADRLRLDRQTLGSVAPYLDDTFVIDAERKVYLPTVSRQLGYVKNQLGLNQMELMVPATRETDGLLSRRFSVVVGSAGSGKTRLLRQVAQEGANRNLRVALTGLTGKAATLLGETGCTLHRLLGFKVGGFTKKTLEYDVIIVDEAPMLTLERLWHLLKVRGTASIIFAGDLKQLGPVSGIAIYRDMVTRLPTVNLDVAPSPRACPIGPVSRIQFRRAEDLLTHIERTLYQWVAEGVDWQVISPVHDTRLGTRAVNRFIQHRVNPLGGEAAVGFRLGDRVIVTKNLYWPVGSVSNGEMGVIESRDGEQLTLRIRMNRRVGVPVRFLELAYCLTIHKVQGSRFARVLVILPEREFPQFCQNPALLEVAKTRAIERTVCLVA